MLAVGSIIQDRSDYDASLRHYRGALALTPNSSQLWNNIGMCFYGKGRYIAAIACLKRALYLDPFQWIVAYNLGLLHLSIQQYASAFHYFSVAINLKPDFANSYMYLGITLHKLDDFANAISSFEKALEIDKDYLIYLNYAIVLLSRNEKENRNKAYNIFKEFEQLHSKLDEDTRCNWDEVSEQKNLLTEYFKKY